MSSFDYEQDNNLAQNSEERIEPAIYSNDLYGVLGVSSNATSDELKKAFWSIAAQNHPDRNDSPEALMLFRNASHAYQILGKDPQTRAEYDRQSNAQMYLQVLEDVGTDVLKPFAMDVAVPLINLTAQALTSFFNPFLKSAKASSTAVLDAAFFGEDANGALLGGEGDTFTDKFQRVSDVMEQRGFEKKVIQFNKQLLSTEKLAQETADELANTKAKEAELATTLEMLRELSELQAARARNATAIEQEARRQFEMAALDEKEKTQNYDDISQEIVSVSMQAERSKKDLETAVALVARLESELVVAKQSVQTINLESAALSENVARLMEGAKERQSLQMSSINVRTAKEREFLLAEAEMEARTSDATEASKELMGVFTSRERSREYLSLLERKSEQLQKKKESISIALKDVQNKQSVILEAKKKQEEEKRKRLEAEAIAQLQVKMEMRKREMERMQLEEEQQRRLLESLLQKQGKEGEVQT